jgi:hypothetical protein
MSSNLDWDSSNPFWYTFLANSQAFCCGCCCCCCWCCRLSLFGRGDGARSLIRTRFFNVDKLPLGLQTLVLFFKLLQIIIGQMLTLMQRLGISSISIVIVVGRDEYSNNIMFIHYWNEKFYFLARVLLSMVAVGTGTGTSSQGLGLGLGRCQW